MSGELSRSLVDAAAEAVNAVILAKCPPNVMPTLPPGCTAKDLADGAVAAVLETLAAHVSDQHPIELVDLAGYGKAYNEGKSYVVGLLQRSAAEVRDVR